MMRRGMMVSAILGLTLTLMVGCRRADSAAESAAPEAGLLNSEWLLVALNDQPVELENEERRPHFTLQAEENRMTGYTGCNQMFGAYVINGDLLSFDRIGATKMACMDAMDLERDFLKAIEATASYYMAGRELELFDADGTNVARFITRPVAPE